MGHPSLDSCQFPSQDNARAILECETEYKQQNTVRVGFTMVSQLVQQF